MIGSINGTEWLILVVIAVLVIGPERLPGYAKQLGNLVRELRRMARGATQRVREEMGPELDELTSFDPRQYDPRRIIKDALGEDLDLDEAPKRPGPATRTATGAGKATTATNGPATTAKAGSGSGAAVGGPAADAVPYDDEAT